MKSPKDGNPPSGGETRDPHTLEELNLGKVVKRSRVTDANFSGLGQNSVNSCQVWPTESLSTIDSGDVISVTSHRISRSTNFERKLNLDEPVNFSESRKYGVNLEKYSNKSDVQKKSLESELNFEVEDKRHLYSANIISSKQTPKKNTQRGNILKANLKTPLKCNIKKLKNDFKKSLTPEKPELLKLFEKMGEKKTLKSALSQNNMRTELVDLGLSNKSKLLTSETPRDNIETKGGNMKPENDPPHSGNTDKKSPIKVKKVSLGDYFPKVAVLPKIDGLIHEKMIDNSISKSAQNRPRKALYSESNDVVRSPDPSIRNISRTSNVQFKSAKGKKSVKEIKKELELRSSRPITNYFSKKKPILECESPGLRNDRNANEDIVLRLDKQTKPKTAAGPKYF